MGDLSTLEQEALELLKSMEYCCDSCNPKKVENDKFLQIYYLDKSSQILKKLIDPRNVEKYLQKNGIDYHSMYDFEDDKSGDIVQHGIIYGENIDEIKPKVLELKNKLLGQDNHRSQIEIILDTKKDSLIVNLISISVPKETVERSILNVLIDKNTEVSWDEIIKNDDDYNKAENKILIKRVSDASRRLNNKIVKKTELKEKLIKQRRNNYSLTKKVTKK